MTEVTGRCPESCDCGKCKDKEEMVVVTEQGMFGDLSLDFEIDNSSQRKAK